MNTVGTKARGRCRALRTFIRECKDPRGFQNDKLLAPTSIDEQKEAAPTTCVLSPVKRFRDGYCSRSLWTDYSSIMTFQSLRSGWQFNDIFFMVVAQQNYGFPSWGWFPVFGFRQAIVWSLAFLETKMQSLVCVWGLAVFDRCWWSSFSTLKLGGILLAALGLLGAKMSSTVNDFPSARSADLVIDSMRLCKAV